MIILVPGPSTLPVHSVLDDEITTVLKDSSPVQCDAMSDDEPARSDDPEDPMIEDLVLEEETKPVKEVEWEEWLPTFYPVYEVEMATEFLNAVRVRPWFF